MKSDNVLFDDQEYLFFYKQFESADIERSSLKKPSDLFINFVSTAQNCLKDFVELNLHKRRLYATIQLKIKKRIDF